jgi:hypothetical protein
MRIIKGGNTVFIAGGKYRKRQCNRTIPHDAIEEMS